MAEVRRAAEADFEQLLPKHQYWRASHSGICCPYGALILEAALSGGSGQ
jgi:hypothetical protein